MSAARDAALLHASGRPGRWGNLGLWAADTPDYFGACQALAEAVGRAAGLQPGDRVLAVACGAGEELRLWRDGFGAAEVLGVEADPALVALAKTTGAGIRLRQGSGTALSALGLEAGSFDRVLCVDAAYHLHPREAFLQAAWTLLRPGGTLAFSDLVLDARGRRATAQLRTAARLCGLAGAGLMTPEQQVQRLQAVGFTETRLQRLDTAVLDGFAAHVRGRRVAPWRWPRVAVTARLIAPCRAAGLGYAMLAATRPAVGAAASPSMRAATA